jgi:hypothetical protein
MENIMKKISINKNYLLITYKILHDILLLILIAFAGILVADALLPGIISSKISFSKMTIALILTSSLIAYLGNHLQISYAEEKINKSKILPILILFSFLLIGNSLLKFTLWQNIMITIISLILFFLFYEILFASKK